MKQIATALLSAQREIKNASKDAQNPHFRNHYATLESVLDAVKEPANKNNIAIVQTGGKDSEGYYFETKLIHESGEELSSRIYLIMDKNNMQGLGSAITYARRYGLAAAFGIGQEDDDGNAASNPVKRTVEKPKEDQKLFSKDNLKTREDYIAFLKIFATRAQSTDKNIKVSASDVSKQLKQEFKFTKLDMVDIDTLKAMTTYAMTAWNYQPIYEGEINEQSKQIRQ